MGTKLNRHRGRIAALLVTAAAALMHFATPAVGKNLTGTLDPSFGPKGSRGLVSYSLGDFAQTQPWIETAPLPGGATYALSGSPFRLYKLGPDGGPVEAFGDGGEKVLRTIVKRRKVEWERVFSAPDGGAIVLGKGEEFGGLTVVNRLLPDGRQDKAFGSGGPRFLPDRQWNEAAVDELGRIVLTSSAGNLVTRLNPSGSLDKKFGDRGYAGPDLPSKFGNTTPYDLAATGTGIYVVSYQRTYRLTPAGQLDLDFGDGDGVVNRGGQKIQVRSDGLFVLGWNGRVAHLSKDGSPDLAYGPNGDGIAYGNAANQGIGTVMADGSVLLISQRNPEDDDPYDITRLDPNGLPDPNFAGDGRLEADWLDGAETTWIWTIPGMGAAAWGGRDGEGRIGLVKVGGELDPSFGSGGVASLASPLRPNATVTDSGQRKDHSHLVVGSVSQGNRWNYGIAVASFDRRGRPESSFGHGGRLILVEPSLRGDPMPRMTLLPSGAAMICSRVGKASLVWKINRRGRLVNGFGDGGRLTLPFAGRCQDISFDGKGAVLSATGAGTEWAETDLIRILPDGSLDQNYGIHGVAKRPQMADRDYYFVHRTRLLSDSKGRTLMVVSDGDARYLARYTQGGFPDKSFGFGGKIHFGWDSVDQDKDGQKPIYLPGMGKFTSVAFGGHGAIFVAGTYTKRAFVAKLNSRGFLIKRYGRKGRVILPEGNQSQAPYLSRTVHARAEGIAARPDGSLIVTGSSRPVCSDGTGCLSPLMLKRVRPNGKVDRKFGMRAFASLGNRPDATGEYVHLDGKRIVVTGSIDFAIQRRNFMIARFR